MRGACLCVKLKSVLEYRCVLSQSLSVYCHHSPCLVVPANMAPDYWTHVSKCGRRGSLVLCNVDCPCMYSVHLHLELIFSILYFISYFSYYPLSFGSLDLCVPTHRMCTLAWYSVYFLVVCRVCFLVYVWAVDVQSVKEIPCEEEGGRMDEAGSYVNNIRQSLCSPSSLPRSACLPTPNNLYVRIICDSALPWHACTPG